MFTTKTPREKALINCLVVEIWLRFRAPSGTKLVFPPSCSQPPEDTSAESAPEQVRKNGHGRNTMVRKMFLLVMLGNFLALGGFWALRAQDPAAANSNHNHDAATTNSGQTSQVDLSGTYAGTFVNCDAAGLTGDTTLTITGNQFTTADGKSGRIIASKTRGYTAVALQMSGARFAGDFVSRTKRVATS